MSESVWIVSVGICWKLESKHSWYGEENHTKSQRVSWRPTFLTFNQPKTSTIHRFINYSKCFLVLINSEFDDLRERLQLIHISHIHIGFSVLGRRWKIVNFYVSQGISTYSNSKFGALIEVMQVVFVDVCEFSFFFLTNIHNGRCIQSVTKLDFLSSLLMLILRKKISETTKKIEKFCNFLWTFHFAAFFSFILSCLSKHSNFISNVVERERERIEKCWFGEK